MMLFKLKEKMGLGIFLLELWHFNFFAENVRVVRGFIIDFRRIFYKQKTSGAFSSSKIFKGREGRGR